MLSKMCLGENVTWCFVLAVWSKHCNNCLFLCVLEYIYLCTYTVIYKSVYAVGVPSSDIVLLVLIFLVFGDFGNAQGLVFGATVRLGGRIADVVTALVHVVGAFVAIAVFVHGVEEDEDAESGRGYDPYHHPRSAAALPHFAHWTGEDFDLR